MSIMHIIGGGVMTGTVNTYTVKHIANALNISVSTVRKYCLLLESHGYRISRNENNVRIFYDGDIMALQELLTKSIAGQKLDVIAVDIAARSKETESIKGNPPAPNDAQSIRELTNAVERLTTKIETMEKDNEETRRAFKMALRKIEQQATFIIEMKEEVAATKETTATSEDKPRGFFARLFRN